MGQFGKQIQSQQIPGWGAYYLDYKALKKIISSLAASQAPSSSPIRPNDLFGFAQPSPSTQTPTHTSIGDLPVEVPSGFSSETLSLFPGQDHDPPGAGSEFHTHKAAFFFKLERELEKVRTKIPPLTITYDTNPLFISRSIHFTYSKRRISNFALRPYSPNAKPRLNDQGLEIRTNLLQTRQEALSGELFTKDSGSSNGISPNSK
jgi:hypothetical protein